LAGIASDPNLEEVIALLRRNTPNIDDDDVHAMLVRHYGLMGQLDALGSERDQVYRVTDADRSYILKISNIDEHASTIDFQVSALAHLARQNPSLPVPTVRPHLNGKAYDVVSFANADKHVVHMLSYLPGIPMDAAVDVSSAARRNLGCVAAGVDVALQGFFHSAADLDHPWIMSRCPRFAPFVHHIADTAAQKRVAGIFSNTASDLLPRIARLRHQVTHQDAHGSNVLINAEQPSEISGLIDFGDMTYSSIVADVAIACDGAAYGAADIVDAMCDVIAGFDSVLALSSEEVDLVFDVMLARNALTATIAAAREALGFNDSVHIESETPYIDRIDALQTLGRDAITNRLRAACQFPVYSPSRRPASGRDVSDELFEKRKKLLGEKATYFYDKPVHFERAEGCFLFSPGGEAYLDCYNNVPQVGHCNPTVVKAICRQAAVLNTNTRYLYSSIIDYAERLTDKLAPHLDACLFVNSGSEANDIAWQMVKAITGRTGGLLMEDAYHGITEPIRQFSPCHPDTPLPDHLEGLIVPDPYRGPYRDDETDIAEKYAADAERAIRALSSRGHGLAAFMIDSAFCSSGVPRVLPGYLQGIERRVRAAKGLMICDEVQSGFGRMGQWWGHELHGVHADIVTMGKPVANGHPLGVVVTSKALLDQFIDAVRPFSTFGGNTVACAAGIAVIDEIERNALIENGVDVGDYLRDELNELAGKHSLIGDVRGNGMLTGLEFVTDRGSRSPATQETRALLELMKSRHVLVGNEGRDGNILKLRPPLVFSRKNANQFIAALNDSLGSL